MRDGDKGLYSRAYWGNKTVDSRLRDRKIMARFVELGYERDESNDNFWCFDGDHGYGTVWWLSNNHKRADHLWCIACNKRWYLNDIDAGIKRWKKRSKVIQMKGWGSVNLNDLLIGD